MDKLYDVTALGEMLIDFTMYGKSEQGNNLFEACPGGVIVNYDMVKLFPRPPVRGLPSLPQWEKMCLNPQRKTFNDYQLNQ